MMSIEVAKVESLEGIGDPCENVLSVFHFLLQTLLRREQALLHAEYRRPAEKTTWYLRSRTKEAEGEDEVLAVLPSAILQSCAARMAVVLGVSHVEGGHGRLELRQEGRRHECSVYLSNCRESGCWMRIYGQVV